MNNEHLNIARALYQNSRYRDAIAVCNNLIATAADKLLELEEILGKSYLYLGQANEALVHFDKAAAIDNQSPELLIHIGDAYCVLNCWTKASTAFATAIKLDEDNSECLSKLAHAYFNDGQLEQALKYCKQALTFDTDCAAALIVQGQCLHAMGMDSEAFKHFQHCLRVTPDNAFAQAYVADYFYRNRRFNEAISSYQAAFFCDNNNLRLLSQQGLSLLQLQRYVDAEAIFRRCVTLQPTDAQTQLLLGKSLEYQGQLKTAMQHYIDVVKSTTVTKNTMETTLNAKAYFSLAIVLRKLGEFKDAYDCCRHALTEDPNNLDTMRLQAELQSICGETAASLSTLARYWANYQQLVNYSPKTLSTKLLEQQQPIFILSSGEFSDDFYWLDTLVTLQQRYKGTITFLCAPPISRLITAITNIPTLPLEYAQSQDQALLIPLQSLPTLLSDQCQHHIQIPYSLLTTRTRLSKQLAINEQTQTIIGIAWEGIIPFIDSPSTDLNETVLKQIVNQVDGVYYGLQWRQEITPAVVNSALIDAARYCEDFFDIAALVSLMDIIITCDCAVAHLAGLLGKKAYLVVNQYEYSYYWSLGQQKYTQVTVIDSQELKHLGAQLNATITIT